MKKEIEHTRWLAIHCIDDGMVGTKKWLCVKNCWNKKIQRIIEQSTSRPNLESNHTTKGRWMYPKGRTAILEDSRVEVERTSNTH